MSIIGYEVPSSKTEYTKRGSGCPNTKLKVPPNVILLLLFPNDSVILVSRLLKVIL